MKDSKHNNIIHFPDGSEGTIPEPFLSDDELEGITYSENHDIEPVSYETKDIIVKEDNRDISEVIDKLAENEVRRMSDNLDFLSLVEGNVKEQVTEAIHAGVINIDTLLEVMNAFGKSIDRSNKIIQDKQSNLVQMLIDNRTQININESSSDEEQLIGSLSQQSRKKLTNLLSALLYEKEEGINDENS